MKVFFLGLLLSSSIFAGIEIKAEYPKGPESSLTPGSLCDRPDSYRYPERIAYCERDRLDPAVKEDVFQEYRNNGYGLNPSNRSQYKIDHLVPLCAGGSNQENNLWPQHMTIYSVTDPMESLGCEKLKLGKIKQADLVRRIIAAKKNMTLVPSTLSFLRSL
jgi:hypothetical protein